jgi:hypothetical protein
VNHKPTLTIHTTYFPGPDASLPADEERDTARWLAHALYDLLTRPKSDPLAWGPGIPVRAATEAALVDSAFDQAAHVVIIPILGSDAFETEESVVPILDRWRRMPGALVLPVLIDPSWRDRETAIPKPLLTELYPSGQHGSQTIHEILLGIARLLSGERSLALQMFISHAKGDIDDTHGAATKIRDYVTSQTTGKAFFDKVSLLAGEELDAQLDTAAGSGVFVAVRGDRYSSRTWCRRELLRAKQARVPTLTVEVLQSGETRSAAYAGNGPTVVWRGAGGAASQVATLAMIEAVRHLHFIAESRRIVTFAGLPSSTIPLCRPPELLDVTTMRASTDAALVILHPDPPLPLFELELLQSADKRVRLLTPTAALSGRLGASLRAPLDGWQVALSVSQSPDCPHSGGPSGLIDAHVTDAITFVARALVGVGAALAYGGDLRKKGFTECFAQLVTTYNETAHTHKAMLHAYLGATIEPSKGAAGFKMVSMRRYRDAKLPVPPLAPPPPAHRIALHDCDVRRVMAEKTQARVVLGGQSRPLNNEARQAGYRGLFPGVVEEAWWTLRADKPLYVCGGFGGAARIVAEALLGEGTPPLMQDEQHHPGYRALADAVRDDPYFAALEVPKNQVAMAKQIREAGAKHLASDAAARRWNGLTVAENKALFFSDDPLTIAALILKGLTVNAGAQCTAKLQVELVEGDIAAATDLELLVFGAFSDVPLAGAGASIDQRSGGAATEAHRATVPVACRADSLGAEFLYAADLGPVHDAVADPIVHARLAAEKAAPIVDRFARVGLVTFFGSVVSDVAALAGAMVDGLRSGRCAAGIQWFERDPARAAMLAHALEAREDVALSRRVVPATSSRVLPERRHRSALFVRHQQTELRTAVLLDNASAAAPSFRAPLSADEVRDMAGKSTAAAPGPDRVATLGTKIARSVFGSDPQQVFGDIHLSEIAITHDESCGGIPFETMGWDTASGRVTPATAGGIVRYLSVESLLDRPAYARPARHGHLDVLVVIDPREDLPGAEAEGKALVKRLRASGFQPKVLKGPQATAANVLDALANPQLDVFHYCGHAYYLGTGAGQSGINCHDRPLTLGMLASLTSMPRLAFVNACQAARVRSEGGMDAHAFAEFFIRAGVNAYLGTFWVVSDEAAASFAHTVYSELANGNDLGKSVVLGRQKLKRDGNDDWANYLLYGDSTFKLEKPGATATLPVEPIPAPSARLQDGSIVATWTFAVSDGVTSFAVAVTDAGSQEPLPLREPMVVDSRADAVPGRHLTTWVVTATPAEPLPARIALTPSDGTPLMVAVPPEHRGGAPAATRGRAAGGPPNALRTLQTLLQQQPDGGEAILRSLQPSADPAQLRARIDAEIEGPGSRAAWPFQQLVPPEVDPKALDAFVAAYGLDPIPLAVARDQTFQTWEDWKAYFTSPGAIDWTLGRAVRNPVWPSLEELTYDVRAGEAEQGLEIALFADNANGLFASRAIARQICQARLPYAVYLGDAYYGGSKQEFAEYVEEPLTPMLDDTELFMLSGNHEMFAKGEWFQNFLVSKRQKHARQRQRGEMFRLRGDGFQVLGVDTMYVDAAGGRLRIHDRADARVLAVLDRWLREAPDALTILMTSNEPWDMGCDELTPLYQSLKSTIAGRVDLWFWGNVHYAALYQPWRFDDAGSPQRAVVGSCIGHGGYPFYTQTRNDETRAGQLPRGVACRWLETKSRFWPEMRVRPDVGANGWCRLGLARRGRDWDVTLRYLDWVGRDRLEVRLEKAEGKPIAMRTVRETDLAAVGATPTWHDVPVPRDRNGRGP